MSKYSFVEIGLKFQASGRDLFDERLSTHRLTLEDDDEEEEIVVAEAEE